MSLTITPAQGALLAASAETMFNPAAPLNVALEVAVNAEWEHVGTLVARNALFGAQRLGLGDAVFFGLVARHRERGDYAVLIRGTEQRIEWLEDAEALFEPHPLGGLVEQGFWSIYRSMTFSPLAPQPQLLTAAAGIIQMIEDSGATITVIGHSLGAPLAAYLALDLAAALGTTRTGTVNALMYACPKPGDGTFGHTFDTTVGHENYAVFNWIRDVVPRLPLGLPFGLGFQSLPNVTHIKPSTGKARIADGLYCNHSALSYAALLGGTTVTPSNPCIEGSNP